MTLSEIKDQIAQQHGWEDWDHLLYVADKHVPFMRQCIEDVMDSAITASIEADRKDCAREVCNMLKGKGIYIYSARAKSSILDRPYPEIK